MKRTVLARPNLKGVLLGALLVSLALGVFVPAQSELNPVVYVDSTAKDFDQKASLRRLLERVSRHPSPDAYYQLSFAYEKRGDFLRALRYLRQAEALSEHEAL
jgi:tetratricopeptide (TPR) repeat protein